MGGNRGDKRARRRGGRKERVVDEGGILCYLGFYLALVNTLYNNYK